MLTRIPWVEPGFPRVPAFQWSSGNTYRAHQNSTGLTKTHPNLPVFVCVFWANQDQVIISDQENLTAVSRALRNLNGRALKSSLELPKTYQDSTGHTRESYRSIMFKKVLYDFPGFTKTDQAKTH